ncbi:MAG: hypothetical protein Q9219_004471 [cf. Caloplaca sp. 3 TL-2023]
MAEVVYTGVNESADVHGQLFGGTKFWLSQKVPQRKRFIDEVKANGGDITPLEKEADIRIVDHTRKEQLPGTYSYRYIELSVRNQTLEDLAEHAVGPPTGTLRTVGSTVQPPKSARTKFTPEDDRTLVKWVHAFEQSGGATSGNEIYKQLESKNPRHTWQSWRDRWVKTLKNLPRSAFIPSNAPPTPPADQTVDANEPSTATAMRQAMATTFSKEDAEALFAAGDDIINILPDRLDDAWSAWASSRDVCLHIFLVMHAVCLQINRQNPEHHTSKEWQHFWEKSVRPEYLKRKARIGRDNPGLQEAPETTTESSEKAAQKQSINLTTRVSPSKQDPKEDITLESPSNHPVSSTRTQTLTSEQTAQECINNLLDGPSDDDPLPVRSPGKRKRPGSEGIEEVPSSSPPEPVRSVKHRRPNNEESLFLEIEVEPTLERDGVKNSPREIQDTLATNVPGKQTVVELTDDEDPELYPDEVGDYASDKSRSLSPELGRSPIKPNNETRRNVSRTQAIFDEPEAPIDFDIPPPEGGFGDEDDIPIEETGGKSGPAEVVEEIAEEFHSMEEGPPQSSVPEYPKPSSNPNPASNLPSPPPRPSSRMKPHQLNTQAILAAETPLPDYSIPDPEGGWEAALLPSSPSELPPPPSSSPPEEVQGGEGRRRQRRDDDDDNDDDDKEPTKTTAARPPSPNPADQLDDFIDRHLALGYTEDVIHMALKSTNLDPVLSVRVLESMLEEKEKMERERLPAEMKGCWTAEDDRDLESVDARRIQRVEGKHGKGGVDERWAFLEEYRR